MSDPSYRPVVGPETSMREFTLRALILGLFMCVILGAANAVPPALVVGALSLLGSCALRRRLHAAILGAAFLAASFFLNVLGQVADLIRPWRKLSVFYWYTANPPLTGEIVTPQIVLLAVVAAILVAVAAVAFGRKDLAV